MRVIGKAAHRLFRLASRALLARRSLRCIASGRTDRAATVATAIRRSLDEEPAPSEGAWIDRIETLRGELLRSRAVLPVEEAAAGGHDRTESVSRVCRISSKKPHWARLLFRLVRETRPETCLELGTCLGVSTAYQAAALALNGAGGLVSLEGAAARAALARDNLAGLGLTNVEVVTGRFHDRLPAVLAAGAAIDYAFVDGHHDERATVEYFDLLVPHLARRAVVVFDDIAWSPGMRRAWRRIAGNPAVDVVFDLMTVGICVIDVAAEGRARYRLALW